MSATLDTFGLNVDRKNGFLLCTANNTSDTDTTGKLIYFPIGDLGNPQIKTFGNGFLSSVNWMGDKAVIGNYAVNPVLYTSRNPKPDFTALPGRFVTGSSDPITNNYPWHWSYVKGHLVTHGIRTSNQTGCTVYSTKDGYTFSTQTMAPSGANVTGTWTNFVEIRSTSGAAAIASCKADGTYYARSVTYSGDITLSGIGTAAGNPNLGPNVYNMAVWPGKNADGSDRLYFCRGNTISQKNNDAVTNAWSSAVTNIPGNNFAQFSYNIRYLKGVDLLYLPSGVWGGSDAWYKPLIRYHNGTSMFIASSNATDDLNLFLMDFAGDDEGNIIGVGRGWDNANTTFGPTTNYIYLNGPNHGGGNWQAGTLPTPVDVLPGSQQLVYCGMDSAEYRG
jgi:hypothetical protein